MAVPFIGGGAGVEENTNVTNAAIRQINSMETVQVYKDEQGTRTVILNKDGLRTTAPGTGIDVLTATDAQFTFNSNNNVFKVVASNTVAITRLANTTQALKTINHNLGYTPAIVAYLGGGSFGNLPFTNISGSGTDAGKIKTRVGIFLISDNDLTFEIYSPDFAGNTDRPQEVTYDIKYYLFRETAN